NAENPEAYDALRETYYELYEQQEEIDSVYIAENPSSYAAVLALRGMFYMLDTEQLEKALTSLDAPLQQMEEYTYMYGKLERMKAVAIGMKYTDFGLDTPEGEFLKLSDVHQGSVLLMDFWASWCGPCKSTMPRLEDFAREMAPDVVLLGVSVDRNATDASDYLASNNFDAMIALYESYAAAFSVSLTYAVSGIPKTYVIDRDGIIRYVGHPAVLPRQTIERLL
ncbi:MAG: TlpA family protein disulfide reductase, partial [Dehalococcoidia bacterium]|nr:TlpA family protein disulfide reductase [Dehalococcoidia bacterium]